MSQMRIFVSHSHEDDAFCRELVAALRSAGAQVWYDEQQRGAEQPLDLIGRALDEQSVFVLILSPAALRSDWVEDETRWAYGLRRKDPRRLILPVTAARLQADAIWRFLQDFPRIEAPGLQPFPRDEAIRRTLHMLALSAGGVTSAPLAFEPDDASTADVMARGQALLAQGQSREALRHFEHATQVTPGNFAAWYHLGRALSSLKLWPEALMALERASVLDPSNAAAWVEKSAPLYALKQHDECLAACDQALALDPTLARAWVGKGNTLYGLKRYQEALAAYDQALTLDPNLAQAWNNKGLALNNLKRYDEALVAYDQALALDPNYRNTWSNKAISLRALGRTKEAKMAERRAKELGGQCDIAACATPTSGESR